MLTNNVGFTHYLHTIMVAFVKNKEKKCHQMNISQKN